MLPSLPQSYRALIQASKTVISVQASTLVGLFMSSKVATLSEAFAAPWIHAHIRLLPGVRSQVSLKVEVKRKLLIAPLAYIWLLTLKNEIRWETKADNLLCEQADASLAWNCPGNVYHSHLLDTSTKKFRRIRCLPSVHHELSYAFDKKTHL
jgi:hypothetical protein